MGGEALDSFGPYVLESVLGRGGMGVVYQARDTRRGRTVALKLLAPELAGDASFQARFRRESQIAARLNDPHVVPIHDFGEIDGRLFIDMRLVEGRSLAERLESGRLPPATAVGIVAQVAGALDAAHAQGLVHRDVKPANILLVGPERPGRPPFAYLVDFGIARVLPTGTQTAQTTTATVGTVSYMAPERILGQPGDHRVDVYSLGCVLFECLTGRRPFDGEPAAVMFAQVHNLPPDPAGMAPGVTPGLRDAIATALAKDPAQRFASAGALADAAAAGLEPGADLTVRVAAPGPPQGPPQGPLGGPPRVPAPGPPPGPQPPTVRQPRPRERRPLVVATIAAAVLAVLGGVLAAVLLSQQGGAGPPHPVADPISGSPHGHSRGASTPPLSGGPSSGRQHSSGPTQPRSSAPERVPEPFTSAALYDYARPYFRPGQCVANPSSSQAPLKDQLRYRELLKCYGPAFTATFWRTGTVAQLLHDRRVFLSDALPGSFRTLLGAPAGSPHPAGFQIAYRHMPVGGKTPGRAFWDSPQSLCGGEIQAGPAESLQSTIAFWRTGRS
ncbi:MAG TPA: serine/threonine-protein kinase [Jatrophihabitans sp.]|nr:serine/threonine-protein kinase [Jatrophihabitans sp.]